jgi:hypothetical protein
MRPFLAASIVVVSLAGLASRAQAMPMFARKYKMACSDCHDAPTFPRLNDVGYKFRRAGFRLPEQIGQEELTEFNLGDYTSGRIQARYTVSHVSDETTIPSTSSTTNRFEMREITLYPLTGSFMKYFATETEISMAPDEIVELENAYVRAVYGGEDAWVEARFGLWHPFEGFAGSDRPLGVSRPLFETVGANQNQDTLVRVWGIDQVGLELGAQWHDTSLSFSVLNGLQTEVEGDAVVGVGITPDEDDSKDIIVFANQILGARSGVSLLWMHGTVRLPTDVPAFVAGMDESTFRDTYDRLALFGGVGAGILTLVAGGELGWDDARDPMTGATSGFRSQGAFLEGDVALGNHVAAFVRLDYFDPSASKEDNERLGATLGASIYHDWVYVIPELQLRSNAGMLGDRTETAGLIHAIAIY